MSVRQSVCITPLKCVSKFFKYISEAFESAWLGSFIRLLFSLLYHSHTLIFLAVNVNSLQW